MKGFTLLELVMTLALLTGLLLLGVISSSSLMSKNEGQILVNEIKTAIQYAKNQSINLGTTVYLAPLDSEDNWSKGMILSQFKNNQIKVLNQWQWDHKYWSVTWKGAHSAKSISFSHQALHALSNGKFTLRNNYSQESIALILNRLGRIRLVRK